MLQVKKKKSKMRVQMRKYARCIPHSHTPSEGALAGWLVTGDTHRGGPRGRGFGPGQQLCLERGGEGLHVAVWVREREEAGEEHLCCLHNFRIWG